MSLLRGVASGHKNFRCAAVRRALCALMPPLLSTPFPKILATPLACGVCCGCLLQSTTLLTRGTWAAMGYSSRLFVYSESAHLAAIALRLQHGQPLHKVITPSFFAGYTVSLLSPTACQPGVLLVTFQACSTVILLTVQDSQCMHFRCLSFFADSL